MAVRDLPGNVTVYDRETKTVHREMKVAKGSAWALAFSPDGKMLAAGTDEGEVQFWHTEDFAPFRKMPQIDRLVRIVSISLMPDSRVVAVAGAGRRVMFWDVQNAGEVVKYHDALGRNYAMAEPKSTMSPFPPRCPLFLLFMERFASDSLAQGRGTLQTRHNLNLSSIPVSQITL